MKRYMQEILVKQKIKNITQRMEAKLLLKVKNSVLVGIYALGIKWTNGRAEDIRRRFQSKSHPILREKRFGNKYYEAASSAKCSK